MEYYDSTPSRLNIKLQNIPLGRTTNNDYLRIYNGLNQTREELAQKFNLIESRKPYSISDEIIFLGQIDRENEFEQGQNLPAWDENGETYEHLDDSGLVIKTENGYEKHEVLAESSVPRNVLTKKEKQILECVYKKFSELSSKEIFDFSYKQKPYASAKPGEYISYAYASDIHF